MKKIVLSLAGVLAATAFAPEASAIPAFARQTGMACNACHQQHFPILNGFGQAFKAAGYTMMGAQGKVEAEHLSIPDTLNAAILLKARYQKDNRAKTSTALAGLTSTGDGQWQIGDEFSLFFGGRVAENIGFMFEGNTANVGGSLVAGFKMPIVFDLGSAKLSAIPFTTDALGVAYGFDQSSAGIVRSVRWAEHRREISAHQYANMDQQATGVALVAQNDMGYINVTKWATAFAPGGNGQAIPSVDFKSNYFRIAATPTVGDWAMVAGIASVSGRSADNLAAGAWADTKATAADLQAHGQVGGKDLGVYVTYAKAPVVATGNWYNAGLSDRSAWTIGADYSVIPHALHIGAAYRSAKDGVTAVNDTDNAWTVTGVYDLTQNVALHLNYSSYSGTSRGAGLRADGVTARSAQTYLYTFLLEAAF